MSSPIDFDTDDFSLRLARSAADLRDAQKLRYEVFIAELGGQGAGVDHTAKVEQDAFDAIADHILLRDIKTDELIGVYRVLRGDQVDTGSGFYSAQEYDLSPLIDTQRSLLELGRSCVHPQYRGGPAMFHLWSGLARYVAHYACEVLFGVASLHGTDPETHAAQLSMLHHRHLAPPDLRARSRRYQRMDLIPEPQLNRRTAMIQMPSLIKAYLRLGGQVGDGAFVDHEFNCTDVLMVMDTARLSASAARRLTEGVMS